jgi:hypothetical protein
VYLLAADATSQPLSTSIPELAMARSKSVHPFVLVALLSITVIDNVAARQHAIQTIADARAQMQAGNFGAAVEILDAVTRREPSNGRAWSLLGAALRYAGDFDRALGAHLRAVEFDDTAPQAMYNVGVVHALMGDLDEAFDWLHKAKATGTVNMTRLGLDAAAQHLRADARFAALLPTPQEYADPFVEQVDILQEWVGEAAGDQFGWIARNIGDVDRDGINDVTTSAPTNAEGDQAAGKVYVYSGRTGALLWSYAGQEGDRLGLGIEAAGDVNADGIPDVVAGAPGGGRAYVFSGDNGTVLLTLQAEEPDDGFGRKVSDIGDVNADGHDDVLVGAPGHDAAGENAGRAYVFSGKDGAVLLALYGESAGDGFGSWASGWTDGDRVFLVVYLGLSHDPYFIVDSDETGNALGGMFVSVVGDVDGDGTPDVYASDWSNNALGPSTGRVYVHSGASGRRLMTLTGEAPGDGFGIGPADAGDVNGDGHDDLIIGAWQHGGAAPSGGKTYLFSGRNGALLRSYTGKVPGETFGFDATGMGDVNGDGIIDFLLTSAWSAINGARSGRMFIVSGRVR